MTTTEEERQRLMQFYAGLTNEELGKIATASGELTDIAREVLTAELHRRGLEIDEPEPPLSMPLSYRELSMIRRFRDLPEALLAKGLLDSAGMECFLADDNMVRIDWFISNLLGGVKLMVRPEDVEEAEQVLQQPIPEQFGLEELGGFDQPRCPVCRSVNITLHAVNKPVAFTSAWLFVPLVINQNRWKCDDCGHKWKEAEPAESPSKTSSESPEDQ